MATRRTWVWVLAAVLCGGLVVIIAIAAAGLFFVTHHIRTEDSTPLQATRAFEGVAVTFGEVRPLFEMDNADQPRLTRPIAQLPTGARSSRDLLLLAWEPEKQRLVRVTLPFWMLRLGRHNLRIARDRQSFDLGRLNIDVDELERIGPTLVIDFRNQDGVRVLVWTQ
jgi:hypothetical protein